MIGWGGGWGVGSMFGIAHLLWWVLLIVAVVLVVRWLLDGGRSPGRSNGDDRALAILKERYARGEIDKPEFDARKRDIA
jgi:Predicted membrane protein